MSYPDPSHFVESFTPEELGRQLGRKVQPVTEYKHVFEPTVCPTCKREREGECYNYTQVVRTPQHDTEPKEAALARHIATIEYILAHGKRSIGCSGNNTQTGGRDFWEKDFPKGQGVVIALRGRALVWMGRTKEWVSDIGWMPTE